MKFCVRWMGCNCILKRTARLLNSRQAESSCEVKVAHFLSERYFSNGERPLLLNRRLEINQTSLTFSARVSNYIHCILQDIILHPFLYNAHQCGISVYSRYFGMQILDIEIEQFRNIFENVGHISAKIAKLLIQSCLPELCQFPETFQQSIMRSLHWLFCG